MREPNHLLRRVAIVALATGAILASSRESSFGDTQYLGYVFAGDGTSDLGVDFPNTGGYFLFDPTTIVHAGGELSSPPGPFAGSAQFFSNISNQSTPVVGIAGNARLIVPYMDAGDSGVPWGDITYNGPSGSQIRVTTVYNDAFPAPSSMPLGDFPAYFPGLREVAYSTPNSSVTTSFPNAKEITARDVFTNPATLAHLHPTVDGPTIDAMFAPYINIAGHDIPIPLSDAAALFGVDHFNWQQTISASFYTVDRVPAGGQVQQPYLDPNPYPDSQYFLTNSAGTRIPSYNESPPLTYQTVFWNEDGDDTYAVANNTTYDYLHFEDTPKLPASFNPQAETRHFGTELVGITTDGEIKHTNIGFSWWSNTIYDDTGIVGGGVGYDRTLAGSGPPALAGGIADVEVFVTPEPSTLALAALGIIGLAAWRCRRKW